MRASSRSLADMLEGCRERAGAAPRESAVRCVSRNERIEVVSVRAVYRVETALSTAVSNRGTTTS